MIIHPNGSDPHSHAACPIFVLSRLLRPEATITSLIDNTITLNATLSDPLIISWICTNRFWILCEGNKSVGHHIYLYSPTHSIIGNILSDIRPFTFVLGLNETEGTISITRKALALYSVFNIFSILGSQRLCRYGVVLRIIIQPVSPY